MGKQFSLLFIVAVIAIMGTISGWSEENLLESIDIPFTKHVLENGLTLIVHEDHKAPIVAVNVWYHVGSKNEKPDKTGFAHLFEHLMFNGSENYNDDYFKLLEPLGATNLNGTTNFDRTNYFQNVPTSALDVVLCEESDRMGSLLGAIDQEKLDEQRGVVLNELKQGENQPYGKVFKHILMGMFPEGHPYRWPVIGYEEHIENFVLDDVHQWFKDYYGAANAYISIAGDIDAETAKAKVEKYFGDIPAGPPVVRYEQWIAKKNESSRMVTQDRVQLPMIVKIWNTPGWGTTESDYLSVIGNVLSVGKTSRLYKRLVYEEQLAVQVDAFPLALEIAGGFGVLAVAKPGVNLADIERIMNEEMDRFLKKGPTKDELKRVKNQRLADFVRGIQQIGGFGGKSDILIEHEVYGGDPGLYKATLERVQNVTAKELRETANEWLSAGDFVLEIHPFPPYQTKESDLDRSQKPETDKPPLAKFPTFERTELDNGLTVLVANYPAAPIVRFRLNIDAGYAADQFTVPGAASMTMGMLDEGTEKRDALEISDELLSLGTNISAGANLDQCAINMDTLKANLDESMELYLDILFNPAFPEKELERLKKERIAEIQQEKTEPNSMALRVLPKLLYGEGHAYNLPMTGSGTEESIGKLQTDDLKAFYETWFKPNNSTLIVTGDVTADEIMPTLEKAFGKWQAGDTPKKNLSTVEMPNETSVYLIDKPGSEQSVIFAGHVAPPQANLNEFEIDMVRTILGGKFTSRLNMNLREDKHWSYGVSLRIPGAEGQRPLFVQAPVQTDKTKEAMVEIQKEIKAVITDRPPTADEIDVTKTNKTLKLTGQWETVGSVESSLNEIVRFNLPDDYYATYAKKIMALEEAKVASVSKDLIHPDKMIWVIVGDRAKIEGGVKELNYGALRYLDADGNLVD